MFCYLYVLCSVLTTLNICVLNISFLCRKLSNCFYLPLCNAGYVPDIYSHDFVGYHTRVVF